MRIQRNVKSEIKSKATLSLPKRKEKAYLSFYSAIERDIRDIEMRLYRIKKALKYYSEDISKEEQIDTDILERLEEAFERYQEVQLDEDDIKTISKNVLNVNHNSKIRRYYSEEQEKEEAKEIVSNALLQKVNSLAINHKEMQEMLSNKNKLAEYLVKVIDVTTQMEIYNVETIWSELRKHGIRFTTLGAVGAAAAYAAYGDIISKMGNIYSTMQESPNNVVKALSFGIPAIISILGLGALVAYSINQRSLKSTYLQARSKYVENLKKILSLVLALESVPQNISENVLNTISKSKECFEKIIENDMLQAKDLDCLFDVNRQLSSIAANLSKLAGNEQNISK